MMYSCTCPEGGGVPQTEDGALAGGGGGAGIGVPYRVLCLSAPRAVEARGRRAGAQCHGRGRPGVILTPKPRTPLTTLKIWNVRRKHKILPKDFIQSNKSPRRQHLSRRHKGSRVLTVGKYAAMRFTFEILATAKRACCLKILCQLVRHPPTW
eukprot:2607883-Pyramimonas_sp.AAC.1